VEDYAAFAFDLKVGEERKRDKLLRHLTDIQYNRSHMEFKQGMFHVLGDTLEIFPPDRDTIYRLEFFGDVIERITEADSFTGEELQELQEIKIFPAKHDITSKEKIGQAVEQILKEMEVKREEFLKQGRLLEAERIKTRTEYDMEILKETGYCQGIENYTRYLNQREPGTPPATLLDYFPDDFLLIADESHISIPQIGGMYNGNYSRKETLINYGFRLSSAHDNRPLKFNEFEAAIGQAVYVSATPSQYELKISEGEVIEQIIRPTGLVDPQVEVRPRKGQIDDLLNEIQKRIASNERVLVTTLTKRSAEDLTDYLTDAGIRVKYLHSDIHTMERIEILRDLRLGKFDVFVNVSGGLKISEPGADLAVAMAVLSSFKNKTIAADVAVFGEMGLLGEIRAIGSGERRSKEAKRLGFTTVLAPPKITSISQSAKYLI
jgi:excinuclease ABC subunit B